MSAASFSQDQLREFVIAGHWNLPKVQEMLAQFPGILNVRYQWEENNYETAIQAAAHAGSVPVAEFLLGKGAPLEICTAAMLGRKAEIERMLAEDPGLINARGAHAIPLLAHAALSGDLALVRMLHERGAHEGGSFALSLAVGKGNVELARWLLENSAPDLGWMNYEGKTPLMIARESENEAMIALLQDYGTD